MVPNKDNIRKWVEALRSGEWQQGRDGLRKAEKGGPTRYCCLGVACELYRTVTKRGTWSTDGESGKITYFQFNDPAGWSSGVTLTNEVAGWLGLSVDDPTDFDAYGIVNRLMRMNDTEGRDFAYIADHLEQAYLTEETTNDEGK